MPGRTSVVIKGSVNLWPSPPVIDLPDHGDGDGGYTCFICSASMKEGEPHLVLQRLVEIQDIASNQLKVIDAIAVVQACLPCVLLSAKKRIEWSIKPRLLDLELEGFYTYARLIYDSFRYPALEGCSDKETVRNLLLENNIYLDDYDIFNQSDKGYTGNVQFRPTDKCWKCLSQVDLFEQHISFLIAVDKPTKRGMTGTNVWHMASYCSVCSKHLLPLYARLWQ